jgi:hypothetical protein
MRLFLKKEIFPCEWFRKHFCLVSMYDRQCCFSSLVDLHQAIHMRRKLVHAVYQLLNTDGRWMWIWSIGGLVITRGEPKCLEENLPQRRFIHHKCYTDCCWVWTWVLQWHCHFLKYDSLLLLLLLLDIWWTQRNIISVSCMIYIT